MSSSSKQSRVSGPLNNGIMLGSGSRFSNSGTITYTRSAKTYTLNDMEKATNNFDSSRILGEGGFGVVYKGVLNDGKDVAVKILKRDDGRGGREFLAEVDMLSRLHQRNLVKLIGICIEKQTRCLVYELVPNENLVTWVRPLLTSKEGLQMIIDPVVKPNIPIDNVVKVAAIASMCVQPEVSQLPFMREVVQALKLVCSEFEEANHEKSKHFQEKGPITNVEGKFLRVSDEIMDFSESKKPLSGYASGEKKVRLSASGLLSTSCQELESFRRQSTSGPLTTGKKRHFCQKLRTLSR